jgi:hypothetical protein
LESLFYCIKTIIIDYDVSKFDGAKSFVLSTTNAFGGNNRFLGIAYLIVGSFCFFITLVFLYKKLT